MRLDGAWTPALSGAARPQQPPRLTVRPLWLVYLLPLPSYQGQGWATWRFWGSDQGQGLGTRGFWGSDQGRGSGTGVQIKAGARVLGVLGFRSRLVLGYWGFRGSDQGRGLGTREFWGSDQGRGSGTGGSGVSAWCRWRGGDRPGGGIR